MKDFVLLYLLRHLPGTVSLSPEFISEVEPLFAGLNPSKNEVCHHTNSINHSAIQES
jgi:hypothetical protein